MVEITEATANPQVRDLFNKGFTAIERNNFDYAIDMLLVCVEREPAFLRARKFLRAATIRRFMARSGNLQLRHVLAFIAGLPLFCKYHLAMHGKRHLEALQLAEKLMSNDPFQPLFIKALGRAAEAAEMPEIAIQTLTLVREHIPDSTSILYWLGQLYLKTGQTQLALQCFEELVNANPNNSEALKALKDTMAVNSMNRDGWEDAARDGGFRSAVKDTAESEILERESKAVKGEQDLEALIQDALEKIKKEPENVNYRRSLASLYADAKRFDEAIETLEETQKMGVGRDPQIDRNIMLIRLRKFDAAIETADAAGDTETAEAQRKERDAFRYDYTQEMIRRYPNDATLRFDMGIQYYEREMLNEAIQQFQAAQRSPKHRLQSIFYLGMCFKRKKQYDMAVEQLEHALTESETMDNTRKEILYQLGLILLETDRQERAMECFKQIYQVDIGYKDIAQRIEAQYS